MSSHLDRKISRRSALRAAGAVSGGLALSALLPGVRGVAAQESLAELSRLAEDVYLWRSQFHNSMFIVTDAGVIVVDPVGLTNPRSPHAYEAAIAAVTDQSVKYVVYSHDHSDHITGGSVFADTAQFVSHTLAAPKIAAQNNPNNPVPNVLVDGAMTLELGGKTVDLIYTGRNHSDNSLVVSYPARRLIFAVDFIPVDMLPFRTLPDSYPLEWIDSLIWIEQNLDFDVLVPGHGLLGTKDHVRQDREYLQELIAAVQAARAAGLADNSPEMTDSVRAALAPKYAAWANWEAHLPENIDGIIRTGAAG